MESFRRRSSAESGISFLERALNGLSTQRSRHPSSPSIIEFSEPSEDFKGPLGLNTLYVPSEPLIDFVFVHGLGGGSRKTWSKTSNPYHYWPKEWLPRDPDFKHVRIHSFGYAATWGEKKNSALEINDFARSLLGELKDDPEIRKDETQLVLIGHSMGGLVIKRAYILARQDPAFQNLISRFHTMYFLATPHRGSDLARTLTNILRVSWGQKPFVNDLEPNSGMIAGINETFRHYAQDLQLWSFYETLQSNLIVYNAMVVDKSSATLGYPHERTALLNADHRGVCKFERPSDPNYKTLRNALSTTVEAITSDVFRLRQEATRNDLQRLSSLTGISELPDDDLLTLEDARVTGSCEWLTAKKEFEEWQISWSAAPSILWLSGNPASGKSVLASHVIGHLEGHNLDCSYFFFKHSIASKSSVSDCLRSLAHQMALSNVQVRKRLLILEENGVKLESNDEKAIWRKLFLGGVFQAKAAQPHYWVIDALDECSRFQSLFSMLSSIDSRIPLRIFITSRNTHEIQRSFNQFGNKVNHLQILVSDTLDDIKLFIADKIDQLPVGDSKDIELVRRILAKSDGSFLWVRLVMQELEHVWSEEGIEEVLNEIPADMNMLYVRTLENMSKVRRAAKLATAILTWTVCASRSLTINEMQCAIKLDINETVQNLDKSIATICGQLVFVDQRSKIQIIHQTARDFLLQEDLDSEFAVQKSEAHAHIATKCLEYLSTNDFRASQAPIPMLGIKQIPKRDLALANYACAFFSEHLYKSSSLQSGPWDALYNFLNSNVLSWIEHLARTGDLHYITRTATNIQAYLDRRAKYYPPLGEETRTVKAWSVDLIRVCAKFRTSLVTSPMSIHWLIPPMCPADSIIARKFTSPHRGLTIVGSTTNGWDDCLTQINYRGSQATAIAYGDRYFAVGLSTGKVMLYYNISCQVSRVLDHSERVKLMKFGEQTQVFATSGLRRVRVWDLNTGNQLWAFDTAHQALALDFTDEDECLIAATQGDYVASWCILDGMARTRIRWHDGFKEMPNKYRQQQTPSQAAFSSDQSFLAVSYRGRPILLYNMESDMFFGECIRRSGTTASSAAMHYPIVAMMFNPNRSFYHLIASYGDGELTIYNPWTLELRHRSPNINAQALACSPDGRTLVTGSSFGTLQIFDLDGVRDEGLTLIYRIDAYDEGVKGLAFSTNSLRFVAIRGSQCRVWEPAVLVRRDSQDGDQSEISDPVSVVPSGVTEKSGIKAAITAIACHHDGEVVFCGKQDGSVTLFRTENGVETMVLYKHVADIAVTHLVWGKQQNILVSADESSRIVIRKVIRERQEWSALNVLADRRFTSSITGLLLSPDNDRLLASGSDFDELWSVQGQILGTKAWAPQKLRTAVCHPLRPEAFITLDPTLAHITRWADLQDLTNPDGVRLNRFHEPTLKSSAVCTSYQGDSIIAELIKPYGNQSSCILECWNIHDFAEDSMTISPLPGFEMLGPSVEHIIAIIGTNLLFLDTDMWVCSLDLKSFVVTPSTNRHFFIPSDWQSTSEQTLFHLSSKDEFIFVKKNELMVIKRGLNYSESISLAKAQQWSFKHGSKLHLTIL